MIKKDIKFRVRHALTGSGVYDISNDVGYKIFLNQNGRQRITSDAVPVSPETINQAVANNEAKVRNNQENKEGEVGDNTQASNE